MIFLTQPANRPKAGRSGPLHVGQMHQWSYDRRCAGNIAQGLRSGPVDWWTHSAETSTENSERRFEWKKVAAIKILDILITE